MIDDLRHLPPREKDAFDLEFSPDQIIFALIIVIALGAILSQFQ